MRNREFYEEELRSLDSIDTSSEAIRRVAKEIQEIEDRERQGKVDREQGIKGTGLNNEARRRLKELRILQGRMERKEELEVLLNMNGIEEFTQEAELDSAQEEALEMVDTIIDSNAERAANEAKGTTTLEEGRTLTGKTGQRESVKGYYMTEVPVQLTTKKRDIQIRKDQMSKNSMLGASIQLVTLQKLATRTDISEAQLKMINRLITYFNRVLDMYAQQDKEFAENVRQAEEVEQDVGVEQEEVAEQEGERNSNPSDKKEEKQPEKIEDEEEIDYDNLTEEQKRNFQIKGLQANLDKIIEQLKALAEQRDAYDKIVNESQNPQEKNQAQLMASKMRMQMTPLQNQAQELIQQINNLLGRVEPTKQDQPQEQAEQSKEEQQVEQAGEEQQVGQAGEEQQVGQAGEEQQVEQSGAEQQVEQAKEEQQKGQAEKQEQEDEREAQVQAETGEKQDDGKAKEKEVEEPEEKKEKQGNQQKQTIENVSGIKAILETLIRVLQAITRNPKLLEGTRQKLVNIQQLPSGIDPKLASTQENSATRENAEEIAERLGANEEEKQEVQHETEKAEEEQGKIDGKEAEGKVGGKTQEEKEDETRESATNEPTVEEQIDTARRSIAKILYRGSYGNENWEQEYEEVLKQNPEFKIENEYKHNVGYQLDDFEVDRIQEIEEQIKELEAKKQEQTREGNETQDQEREEKAQRPSWELDEEKKKEINDNTSQIAQEVAESQAQQPAQNSKDQEK